MKLRLNDMQKEIVDLREQLEGMHKQDRNNQALIKQLEF
jgi:hypothetical protein